MLLAHWMYIMAAVCRVLGGKSDTDENIHMRGSTEIRRASQTATPRPAVHLSESQLSHRVIDSMTKSHVSLRSVRGFETSFPSIGSAVASEASVRHDVSLPQKLANRFVREQVREMMFASGQVDDLDFLLESSCNDQEEAPEEMHLASGNAKR